MTLQELAADTSFDRHLAPRTFPQWLALAAQVNAMNGPELERLTASHRESLLIGLRSLDHPTAAAAVRRLSP